MCMTQAQIASGRTNVEDISLAQLSLVWNPMTDDLVYRPGLEREQGS